MGLLRQTRPPHKRKSAIRMLSLAVWIYVICLATAWLLLVIGGDKWWLSTVMLFGPRWIYALPLLVSVPFALALRRRLLWPLAVCTIVCIVPIMGYRFSLQVALPPDVPTVKAVTWNVEDDCVDEQMLLEIIKDTNPDFVALQECNRDLQLKWPDGWHECRQGRLVIGSIFPIVSVDYSQSGQPPDGWSQTNALRCIVDSPNGHIGFVNVHLGTPRYGLCAVLSRKTLLRPSKISVLADSIRQRRLESDEVERWIDGTPCPVVITGDFNMPTDSTIYQDVWSKYINAFSVAGCGFGYTKMTEVAGMHYGSRIDHILACPGWRPLRCWVGDDLGSDHLPLIAEIAWADHAAD